MKALTVVGVALVVLGALVLAYPTLSYTDRERVIDAGPVEVVAETEESVTIPRIFGGVAVAAGIGVLLIRQTPGRP